MSLLTVRSGLVREEHSGLSPVFINRGIPGHPLEVVEVHVRADVSAK